MNTKIPEPEKGRPLTESEAARYLNIPISTLQRWRQTGGGPRWFRLSGMPRYHLIDLRPYLPGKGD